MDWTEILFNYVHLGKYPEFRALLLEQKCEKIIKNNPYSLLHETATWIGPSYNKIALELINNHKVDISVRNSVNQTVFHQCSFVRDNSDFIDIALSNTTRSEYTQFLNLTDDSLNTALHIAAERGAQNVVLALLCHGAVIDTLNKNGKTAKDLSVCKIKVLHSINLLFDYVTVKYDHWKELMYKVFFWNEFEQMACTPGYVLAMTFAKNSKNLTIPQMLVSNGHYESLKKLQDKILEVDGSVFLVPKEMINTLNLDDMIILLENQLKLFVQIQNTKDSNKIKDTIAHYCDEARYLIDRIYGFCVSRWNYVNFNEESEVFHHMLMIDPLAQIAEDSLNLLKYDESGDITYLGPGGVKEKITKKYIQESINRPLALLLHKIYGGKTMLLIQKNSIDSFSNLIEKNMNLIFVKRKDNYTLLHMSLELKKERSVEKLLSVVNSTEKLFQEKTKWINMQDQIRRETCLHLATKSTLNVIIMLLANGAYFNVPNHCKKVPVELFKKRSNSEKKKFLLKIDYCFKKSMKQGKFKRKLPTWMMKIEKYAEKMQYQRCLAIINAKDFHTNLSLFETNENCAPFLLSLKQRIEITIQEDKLAIVD